MQQTLPIAAAGYREPSVFSPSWPFSPTHPVVDAIRSAEQRGLSDPQQLVRAARMNILLTRTNR